MLLILPSRSGVTGQCGTERGVSHWTKNCRTGAEAGDPARPAANTPTMTPVYMLPERGREWWRARAGAVVTAAAAAG